MNSTKKRFDLLINVLTFLLVSIFFFGCNQNEDYSNTKYSIGPLEGEFAFSVLTPQEMQLDSLLRINPWFKNGFKNNRSRIFMQEFRNSFKEQMDPAFDKGVPAPCIAFINKDTINIKTWLGFFGGYVFMVKIYGDKFAIMYAPSMDENIYKSNLADSMFMREITVDSRIQKMILQSKPHFRENEQITGIVEFATNNYFVKTNGSAVDTAFNSGRIYFTCTVSKYSLADKLF